MSYINNKLILKASYLCCWVTRHCDPIVLMRWHQCSADEIYSDFFWSHYSNTEGIGKRIAFIFKLIILRSYIFINVAKCYKIMVVNFIENEKNQMSCYIIIHSTLIFSSSNSLMEDIETWVEIFHIENFTNQIVQWNWRSCTFLTDTLYRLSIAKFQISEMNQMNSELINNFTTILKVHNVRVRLWK